MLQKLEPLKASEIWDDLYPNVKAALPQYSANGALLNKALLQAVLRGVLTCWLLTDDNGSVFGVMTTTTSVDFVTGVRSMLIYTLRALRAISDEEYIDGIKELKGYCEAEKCDQIIAYTKIPKVVEVIESMGGQRTDFIQLEV